MARKQFAGTVVTWLTKNTKTYITVTWDAGGRPYEGEATLHIEGGKYVLYVHDAEIGEEAPQLILAVGYMSPGVRHLARGLKITGGAGGVG